MSEPRPAIEPGTMRATEALESLDGFEQTGIEDYWREKWEDLGNVRLTLGLLAMLKRREGMKAADAWQAAKSMTIGEQNRFFLPEPTEDEDEVTDAGKDKTEPEPVTGPTHDSSSAPASRSRAKTTTH